MCMSLNTINPKPHTPCACVGVSGRFGDLVIGRLIRSCLDHPHEQPDANAHWLQAKPETLNPKP